MRDARAAQSESAFGDMLCLLVCKIGIPHDEVEDMPYLRSAMLIEWYVKVNKSQQEPDGMHKQKMTFGNG